MNHRKRRPNIFGWAIFGLIVLFGYYFDQVYLPTQPNPFVPTPTPTRSSESYLTEAQGLFNEGKLFQAVEAYQSAIKSSPQDSSLYVDLARVQAFAGQYSDAQSSAENAILLNPNNSMAHAVHAWVLDLEQNNGDAMEEINRALEIDPNNAIAYAYQVEILVDSGSFDNLDKARDVSRKALALDPNAMETHRARGLLLGATGLTDNYEEAIREYDAAININPNIPILYIEEGLIYRYLQVYDKAIDAFQKANVLNPADPLPDLYTSRTYATEGEYAKAVQFAEEAVKNRPDDASLRGNLGVMYYRNLMWPEAVIQLGYTIYGGKTEDGYEITSIPLSNDLLIAEYYYTYGLALARTNKCGEALQIAQTLQSRIPSDDNATAAAAEINKICQENLNNPPVSTTVPTSAAETAVPDTGTPAITPTP